MLFPPLKVHRVFSAGVLVQVQFGSTSPGDVLVDGGIYYMCIYIIQ